MVVFFFFLREGSLLRFQSVGRFKSCSGPLKYFLRSSQISNLCLKGDTSSIRFVGQMFLSQLPTVQTSPSSSAPYPSETKQDLTMFFPRWTGTVSGQPVVIVFSLPRRLTLSWEQCLSWKSSRLCPIERWTLQLGLRRRALRTGLSLTVSPCFALFNFQSTLAQSQTHTLTDFVKKKRRVFDGSLADDLSPWWSLCVSLHLDGDFPQGDDTKKRETVKAKKEDETYCNYSIKGGYVFLFCINLISSSTAHSGFGLFIKCLI